MRRWTPTLARRWPRILLCLAWFQALTGLLVGQRYTAFLRPEFGVLLALAALAFVVLAAAAYRDRASRAGSAELVRLAILVLPLAYLTQARGTSLGHDAFVKRYLGAAPAAASAPAPEQPPPAAVAAVAADGVSVAGPVQAPEAAVEPGSPPLASESGMPAAPPQEVSILDLYWGPHLYEGRRVRLVGRLHRDARLAAFGQNVILVFRFVITCCAADAQPATVLVDCSNAPVQADGDWVTVEGVVAVREHEGQGLLFMEDATVTPSAEPDRPYLY